MRIRRRPQPSLQAEAASDLAASTVPLSAAARSRGWCLLAGGEDEDREAKLHAGADHLALELQKSGVARRLALPQDDNVVVDFGRSMGAPDDARMRFSTAVLNGHGGSEHGDGATCTGGVVGRYKPAAVKAEERRVTSDGSVQPAAASAPTVAALVKDDEGKKKLQASSTGTGAKKRRGPAVLLEGSRCSRVNGRRWRCSQPTLVGYSLCEHHLGKGRMRSAAAAERGGGGGVGGRLGRTQHGARITSAAAPAAPKAQGPSLPG